MQQENQYRFVINDPHSGVTNIENIFITEYMPRANPAYVKVYLYGLMAAGNPGAVPFDNKTLADLFKITEGDVVNAWQYWQDQGILEIRFAGQDQFIIHFYNINEVLLRGKPNQNRTVPADALYNAEIQNMFDRIQVMYGGRIISRADMSVFISWLEDFGFDTGTVILLVEYVLNILNAKGQDYNETGARNYMKKVATVWHNAGITHYQEAECWLTENKKRRALHYKVMRALGLNRNPSLAEEELIDTWQNELGLSEEMIDYALKRTTKPTVQYVNSILKNWASSGYETVEMVQANDHHGLPRKPIDSKLSEEDKESYREKQQWDDAWMNTIEDNFDAIYQKLHGDAESD